MYKRVSRFLQRDLVPIVACIGLAFAFGATRWGQSLETGALDQLTRLRTHFQPAADPRLVTLAIDDDSLRRFGHWPWSRQVHADLIYAVAHGKPAALAWDILFTESSDADTNLADAAAKLNGRAIFGAYSSDEDPQQPPASHDLTEPLVNITGAVEKIPSAPFALLPIPALREGARTAFVNTPGERRWVPLLQRVNGQVFPSLSLQSMIVYWQLKPSQVRIVLGDAIYLDGATTQRRIPVDDTGAYLVNYRFGTEGANRLSYGSLLVAYVEHFLLDRPHKNLPPIEGKILLVGQYSTGLTDNGVTPFDAETPLVLVHANIIENILREDFARRAADWVVLLGLVLVGGVGLSFLQKRTLLRQSLFALSVPLVYVALAATCWIRGSVWLPLLWPVLGFGALQVVMIVRQLIHEQRAKQRIKGMFGTYVSPDLVNRMIDSGQPPELGGHEANITAYFSDIQAFSTFSEQLPPDRLVVLMNEYLSACTDIIQAEGGALDKYIGDAVVAMFGAPLPQPDHAFRACVASQRVHHKVLELREKWKSQEGKWPSIVHEMQSRIGLNSGPVVVGNMGSTTRFNYTMMGDNVNLAARMESGAKSWGVYSMCTETTKLACERDGGDRVVFRALGRIVVKGRTAAVPIFEIVGLKENVSADTRDCLQFFDRGLALHDKRDWAGALALFEQSARLEMHQPTRMAGVTSNPSLVYIGIVQRYQIAPPPVDWQGEFTMTVK